MEDYNSGQFITADDAINSLLSREGDIAGVKKLVYKGLAKDVYMDLNLSAIKRSKRVLLTIDPHLRSISLPDDCFHFSTLIGITHYGRMVPLVYNANITDDIVDQGLDTKCECGCTDVLCNYQKHYETIEETVSALMPNDTYQDFTKIIRKFISDDGSVYMEVTEPVAKYEAGEHISTELVTTKTSLCKLEVEPCGCIKATDHNKKHWAKFASSCTAELVDNMWFEWGCPDPGYFPASLTYNMSDDRTRIIFPSHFSFKKILVRYYVTESTKNILIASIAKEAFICGVKKMAVKYDKLASRSLKLEWADNYNKALTKMTARMSACMLHEFYEYYFGRNATAGLYFNHNKYGYESQLTTYF